MAAASLDLKAWFPADNWFMPTSDLVNIYAALNASGEGPLVEPQWINECAVLFYAGSFGVSHFGDLIYPLLAPKLGGVLLEQFFDFPVGGVDDDAAWTSFMWNRLAEWLVYGPPPDDPPPNLLKLAPRKRHHVLNAKRSYISSIRSILKKEPSYFEFQTMPSGAAKVGLKSDITPDQLSADVLEAIGEALFHDYLLVLYPELEGELSSGRNAGAVDTNDVMHRIESRAKVIKSANTRLERATSDNDRQYQGDVPVVASGHVEHEYFGSSLASLSNGRDVLVGSPGAGQRGGPQEGSASLLLGASSSAGGLSGSVLFKGGQGVMSARATSFPSYERFGWATAACDVNRDSIEDIVICAPSYQGGRNTTAAKGNYTGRCDVYFGPFTGSEDVYNVDAHSPNMSLYGDKEWGNFGYSVSCGDMDADGYGDLIVSAPFAGSYADISPDAHGDVSSQGAAFIFYSESLSHIISTTNSGSSSSGGVRLEASAADVVLQPQGFYQWFGKSLDIATVDDRSVLLVGAPVFHSGDENSAVGRLYAYDMKSFIGEENGPLFSMTGCNHAGSTSHAIASSDTHLAFSETGWNSTDGSVLRGGRVLAVAWNSLMNVVHESRGVDIAVCNLNDLLGADAVITAEGTSFDGRYGSSLRFASNTSLIIGAPLADDGRGRVFHLDISTGTETEVYASSLGERGWGKARVGQSLAVVPGGDGVFVGAPYSTCEGRGEQTGRVLKL